MRIHNMNTTYPTPDSCLWANDDVCDAPNEGCDAGTDTTDCAGWGPNSCKWAYNKVCDGPSVCAPGSDTADCA